ncbi:molecular chaperone TorD family protein [bacterium]|nr:molecular chaperone TorD family protein [bacterium]
MLSLDSCRAYQALCSFCAWALYDEPAERQLAGFPVDALGEPPFAQVAPESARALARELARDDREALLHEVALDRTYLFYMVGVSKTSPYESVYRTDDATLFGPTCLQVRKAYEDQGVAFERRASEPEDHLGLEFSFCATLLGRVSEQLAAGDDERARETLAAVATFLSEHPLVFAPIYLDHVATRAKSAYYRSIAGICRGTLESLARDLDVAPAETLDASALEIS